MNARDNLVLRLASGDFMPLRQPRHDTSPLPQPPAGLTEREQDILIMISLGLCNKTIARRMNISVRTVENHRSNLRNKLGTGTADRLAAVLSVILGSSSHRVASLLQVDSQTVEAQRDALRHLLN